MELGLTMALGDVQVETEGTVLLPGRLLGDVVRSLPAGRRDAWRSAPSSATWS